MLGVWIHPGSVCGRWELLINKALSKLMDFVCSALLLFHPLTDVQICTLPLSRQVEMVANGFAHTEGPQWVNDEEVRCVTYIHRRVSSLLGQNLPVHEITLEAPAVDLTSPFSIEII